MPITTQFGFHSTAEEVTRGIDFTGKRVIVTGEHRGSASTARTFAAIGAEVTLAVRDLDAGRRVAVQLAESTGNASIEARRLDLADRASISSFVASWSGPLHVLVNNAGILAVPQLEKDGRGLGTAIRYELPRTLRVDAGSSRCTCRSRQRARRCAKFEWPPVLARGVR